MRTGSRRCVERWGLPMAAHRLTPTSQHTPKYFSGLSNVICHRVSACKYQCPTIWHSQIVTWMRQLQVLYPTLTQVFTAGSTYLGQTIYGIRVSDVSLCLWEIQRATALTNSAPEIVLLSPSVLRPNDWPYAIATAHRRHIASSMSWLEWL